MTLYHDFGYSFKKFEPNTLLPPPPPPNLRTSDLKKPNESNTISMRNDNNNKIENNLEDYPLISRRDSEKIILIIIFLTF